MINAVYFMAAWRCTMSIASRYALCAIELATLRKTKHGAFVILAMPWTKMTKAVMKYAEMGFYSTCSVTMATILTLTVAPNFVPFSEALSVWEEVPIRQASV